MEAQRSAREVLDDHLRLAAEGDVETDLARNFADGVVLLTTYGVYRGKEGVRQKAKLLADQMPNGRWSYVNVAAEGELGFLEWTAEADNGARVEDGADSYLIRDGRIHAMSIHYTVLPPA
jgi:hypothetical protein